MLFIRTWRQTLISYLKRSSTNGQVKKVKQLVGLISPRFRQYIRYPISFPPILAFSLSLHAKYDPKEEEKKLLEKADELFKENKLDQLMELLKSMSSWYDNNEILWRVARCQYHQLKYRSDKNSKEYKEIMENSVSLMERSLELEEKCGAAHKWAAIILDAYSSSQGTKARIAKLMEVKKHMEQAIEFSPTDPTSYYLLGEWHYSCCSVSWTERNIANLIYGKLPDASYETALQMFEKAEELQPGFYSKNKIMIAKTLLALNRDKDKVATHLREIVTKYKESKKWDDVEAFKEATTLLYKIGIKLDQ